MPLHAASPDGGQDVAAAQPLAVVGRITARPGELDEAIDKWLVHLGGLKKRPGSIKSFRQVLRAAIRTQGWSAIADVTYENVIGYMDQKVAAGEWSGTTYNRNLSCFRSFTRYLRRKKLLPDDPLADVDRAEDDSSPDCRAATLDEARSMIRHAWVRVQADRRSTSARDVYWACLFGHGCRPGEPERWQWKHLRLDEVVPHVHWTKDINKNRLEQDVALSPWLAQLLREHRARMLDAAALSVQRRNRRTGNITVRPISPDNPDAFVFPKAPPRTTFRKDRDVAGVAAVDRRGLAFSPRSARKFFKTEMLRLGADPDMVRRLMRHAPHPDERYFDPSLEEQGAAAATMPTLWPDGLFTSSPPSAPIARKSLTAARALPDDATTTPMNASKTNPTSPGRAATAPSEWYSSGRLSLPGAVGFSHQGVLGPGLDDPASLAALVSTALIDPVMPITGSQKRVDTTGLADLIADVILALAWRLRPGAPPDGPQPPAAA